MSLFASFPFGCPTTRQNFFLFLFSQLRTLDPQRRASSAQTPPFSFTSAIRSKIPTYPTMLRTLSPSASFRRFNILQRRQILSFKYSCARSSLKETVLPHLANLPAEHPRSIHRSAELMGLYQRLSISRSKRSSGFAKCLLASFNSLLWFLNIHVGIAKRPGSGSR